MNDSIYKADLYRGAGVLITGGTKGIGLACARAYAGLGARVCVVARNHGDNLPENVRYFKADACLPEQFKNVIEEINSKERIDILINNVGMVLNKPAAELSLSDWQKVIDVNLTSAFICSTTMARQMTERMSGCIINLSSVMAHRPLPKRLVYAVSKAGLEGLTRVLAIEWGKYNIRINAITPGHILTPLVEEQIRLGNQTLESMAQRTVFGRIGSPGEIADLCLYLSSPAAKFITGQTIFIDGGFSIKKDV